MWLNDNINANTHLRILQKNEIGSSSLSLRITCEFGSLGIISSFHTSFNSCSKEYLQISPEGSWNLLYTNQPEDIIPFLN